MTDQATAVDDPPDLDTDEPQREVWLPLPAGTVDHLLARFDALFDLDIA